MITQAQRAAVLAADLPFDLSDEEIANQWNADGSPKPLLAIAPMAQARHLARAAMNAMAADLPLAA